MRGKSLGNDNSMALKNSILEKLLNIFFSSACVGASLLVSQLAIFFDGEVD